MRCIKTWCWALFMVPLLASAPGKHQITLRGHAVAGKPVERPFGPFVFVLRTGEKASPTWSIEVRLRDDRSTELCNLANTPLHGPTPLDIEPIDFMPQGRGDFGDVRNFDFWLSAELSEWSGRAYESCTGHREIFENHLLHPADHDEHLGHGTLKLSHIQWSPHGKGKDPSFKSMDYEVSLRWQTPPAMPPKLQAPRLLTSSGNAQAKSLTFEGEAVAGERFTRTFGPYRFEVGSAGWEDNWTFWIARATGPSAENLLAPAHRDETNPGTFKALKAPYPQAHPFSFFLELQDAEDAEQRDWPNVWAKHPTPEQQKAAEAFLAAAHHPEAHPMRFGSGVVEVLGATPEPDPAKAGKTRTRLRIRVTLHWMEAGQ
jgi:hypothetical protein